jgi:hypothetical protein
VDSLWKIPNQPDDDSITDPSISTASTNNLENDIQFQFVLDAAG